MSEAATFEGVIHVLATRAPFSYAVCGMVDELTLRVKFLRKPHLFEVAEVRKALRYEYLPAYILLELDFEIGGARELVRA